MRKLWRVLLSVAVVAVAIVAAGCGDDGSGSGGSGGGSASGSDGGGAPIRIATMLDVTGANAVYQPSTRAGLEFGIKELNDAGGVNGHKIEYKIEDTGSEPQQGASLMTAATKSDAVAMVAGNVSSVALAAAPIAQRAKMPYIGIQSGSAGFVETGDMIYRITMPQTRLFGLLAKELSQNQDVKSTALIYAEDVPTLNEVATKVWPKEASANGIKVDGSFGVSVKDTDFSSIASKIADSDPDAVLILGAGPQNTTMVKQLKRAGWSGKLAASPGVAGGLLKTLGEDANGMIYPLSFHRDANKEFADRFEEATGKQPDNFTAEAYDAVQLLAAGIKNVGDEKVTKESLAAGLDKAVKQPFDGAQGKVSFEGHDARTPGVLVEWENGGEKLLVNGADAG